jgi:hypothetical protein
MLKTAITQFALLLLLLAIFFSLPVQGQESTRIQRPATDNTNYPLVAPEITQSFQAPPMRVALPQPMVGVEDTSKHKKSSDKDLRKSSLTEAQLRNLASHDIVLLIDKSFSMGTPDCPAQISLLNKMSFLSPFTLGIDSETISRWDWCLAQTSHMAKETEQALPNGFTVVLFDGHPHAYSNVRMKDLRQIFSDYHPGGSTKLELPLDEAFSDYFAHRQAQGSHIKPLLIGIITDGCPTHPELVQQVIASATQHMRNPNEITIVFFLIGKHDRKGEQFVYELSHDAISDGAKFNIVRPVPFAECEQSGLVRALAEHL